MKELEVLHVLAIGSSDWYNDFSARYSRIKRYL